MRRFTCMILALVLAGICGIQIIQSLKMDDLKQDMENRELWTELRKDHVMNLMRNYHADAQGWTNEYGTNYEKRANVKKWWWLLYSNGNRQKQQKWKKGPASLVCYFKVCAVPAV
ncbi:uncharacterized protein LOC121732908 [Aricia agestis]|uniref:uncharacterized protein LOC121732908 n=1 Tax=Aricia agestis TaxID=91739 RepID=UPI001C209D26|nr:uncharacterized protein LOC121732908 [Aricia agestis]